MPPRKAPLTGALAGVTRVTSGCLAPSREIAPASAVLRPPPIHARSGALAWRRRLPRSTPIASQRKLQEQMAKIDKLETRVAALKASKDETAAAHGKALFDLAAEHMLWRKRYRTLTAKHNRWVADVKETNLELNSDQNSDLLNLLAEAATLAEETDRQERADAAQAAIAVLQSRQALEDAKKRNEAADETYRNAKAVEHAAAMREEAVAEVEAALAERELTVAAEEQAISLREASAEDAS